MPHHLTEAQWIDRFMNRLGSLLPSLKADDALDHAKATFPDASDLEPEEAAEIYALELPPADAGTPGD